MGSAAPTTKPPTKIGLLVFPGFQVLDAFGPMDALNILTRWETLELAVLAPARGPVSTSLQPGGFGQTVLPTHTLETAPEDLEVLLIPGGAGARDEDFTDRAAEYVRRAFPNLRFLLTVCTGAVIAAKSGVLDGRRATTNKMNYKWVRAAVVLIGCVYLQGPRRWMWSNQLCTIANHRVLGHILRPQCQLGFACAMG
jgi:putative intracellular protease/amidase